VDHDGGRTAVLLVGFVVTVHVAVTPQSQTHTPAVITQELRLRAWTIQAFCTPTDVLLYTISSAVSE